MAGSEEYFRTLAEARRVALALTAAQGEVLLRVLQAYADELAARVAAGIASRSQQESLRIAEAVIRRMSIDLARATREGVAVTARRLAELHSAALQSLLSGSAAGAGITVSLAGIGASAAQAVLARPELSAVFVSVAAESTATVDDLIRTALLRGQTQQQLAMALRLHLIGADALPASLLLDRRTIGKATLEALGLDPSPENVARVRQMAGRVAYRGELIARAETMNAELEVDVQASAASPVVAWLQWLTSQRHPKEDICDDIQDTDWYGLGEGVFPPELVPARPHPNDLCRRRHILRPQSQWGQPRGALPELLEDPAAVAEASGRSPSQVAALVRAFSVAEARRAAA